LNCNLLQLTARSGGQIPSSPHGAGDAGEVVILLLLLLLLLPLPQYTAEKDAPMMADDGRGEERKEEREW
jgi:hypothetical protein